MNGEARVEVNLQISKFRHFLCWAQIMAMPAQRPQQVENLPIIPYPEGTRFSFVFSPFLCYVMLCYVMLCYVLFCFVLFCFVLFCFVLFCFVLFCFVSFRFVLFRFVSFRFVSFRFIMYVML